MGTVEDAFVMPSAWLRAIRPRRGGAPAGFRPSPTWAADVAKLVAGRPSLRASLGAAGTPADIRDAGLAHVDGGASPLGAAAVVAAYAGPPDDRSRAAAAVFADGWVAGHGLRFAVEAVMELQGLGYGADWQPTTLAGEPVVRRVRGSEGVGAALGPVRAAIAAAPEDEHRAVVELLGAWRERSATHRIVAAHLAPTEESWVEREVRARRRRRLEHAAAARVGGGVTGFAEQTLLEVRIAGGARWARERPRTFGELDPVTVSEIIKDLREVMQ